MSDDLKERLANHPEAYSGGLCKEALARIKELETQLATARADALRKAADVARSCALSETSDAHYACGAILALIPEKDQ